MTEPHAPAETGPEHQSPPPRDPETPSGGVTYGPTEREASKGRTQPGPERRSDPEPMDDPPLPVSGPQIGVER